VPSDELTIATMLSVTGAELKRQILAAVNQGDSINSNNMKLVSSGHVIDDDAILLQQLRVSSNSSSSSSTVEFT